MSQYYFVGASLPSLSIGIPPELSYQELITIFEENLSSDDLNKVSIIRRYYDLYNMRMLLNQLIKGEEAAAAGRGAVKVDHEEGGARKGNLDCNELEERLLTGEGLVSYIQDYLDLYNTSEKRVEHFPYVLVQYFREEGKGQTGFIRKWLAFERASRIVLVALRAKVFGKDVVKELQFEDLHDDLVADIIAQKDAKSYDPPEEFSDLKALYEEYLQSPLELNQKIEEWRFRQIYQLEEEGVFSMDHLLSYLIRLAIVEKWFSLDKKKGMEIVDSILEDAS